MNHPPDSEEEEIRRRREREQAMEEQLLRAQEEEDDDDDQEPRDPLQPQQQQQPQQAAADEDVMAPVPSPVRHRIKYVPTSFAAALLLLYYALRTRQQWYLALLFLTSSKWAYLVLGNALIALCVWTFRFFTKTFLQGLRLVEAEGLGDFFRWNITETCLALTMFRTELEVSTFLVFLVLILAKCLHWVAELREQHLRMTQEAIVPSSTATGFWRGHPVMVASHVRLFGFLQTLILLDICAVTACGQDLIKYGPSVSILFAFESAILLVTAMSSLLLWHLHVLDGWLHYLHDHTRSNVMRSWLHAWKDRKATLTFAVEVQAQGAKFLFYVTFFAIVLTYYGLPINLFREVYMSFLNLKNRLVAFAKYRRLMASMNRFESVESEEELEEAGRVCIICRDDMTVRGCKKLPGCGHLFHSSCLREWLVQQQSCPTCRGDITAMEARERLQRQQDRERRQDGQAAAAAVAVAEEERRREVSREPVQEEVAAASAPALVQEEQPATASSSRWSASDGADQACVFPCLYRVTSEGGAHVWNEAGDLVRTVAAGVVVLCLEMRWNSFHGRSGGMMLKIPDGWVREEQLERLLAVQLLKRNEAAGTTTTTMAAAATEVS